MYYQKYNPQLQTSRIAKNNARNVILPSVAQYMKKNPFPTKESHQSSGFRLKTQSNAKSQEKISKSSSPKTHQLKKQRAYSYGCRSEQKDIGVVKEKVDTFVVGYKNQKRMLDSQELILKLKEAHPPASLKVRTEESERTQTFFQDKNQKERILDLLFLSTQELKDVFTRKARPIKTQVKVRIPRLSKNGFPADFFSIY